MKNWLNKFYVDKTFGNTKILFYGFEQVRSIYILPSVVLSYNHAHKNPIVLFELEIIWVVFCFSISVTKNK